MFVRACGEAVSLHMMSQNTCAVFLLKLKLSCRSWLELYCRAQRKSALTKGPLQKVVCFCSSINTDKGNVLIKSLPTLFSKSTSSGSSKICKNIIWELTLSTVTRKREAGEEKNLDGKSSQLFSC